MLVVMGSPAADPDSLVGSIAYASLLEREGSAGAAVLPFLPIPRQDLRLRPETLLLFERTGLDSELLLCADELDLKKLLRQRDGRLVLIDTQGGELDRELRARVVEVIDHHAPETRPERLARCLVEPVGSACSLVGEQILQRRPEILERGLAALLLATILLDTAGLAAEAGRATVKDREVALGLERICGSAGRELYRECVELRRRLPGLDSEALLRRDYKQGVAGRIRYGLSSVPMLFEHWRAREARLEEAVDSYRLRQGLDLLVVLLFYQGERFQRQLLLCAQDRRLLAGVVGFFTSSPLRLHELAEERAGGGSPAQARDDGPLSAARPARIVCFQQGATDFSRKRLEPLLREFLQGHER